MCEEIYRSLDAKAKRDGFDDYKDECESLGVD